MDKDKKYKVGYLCKLFQKLDWEEVSFLKTCKEKCERLIVGIPSDELYLEIMGKASEKQSVNIQEMLMELKAVDDVISVNNKNLCVRDSYFQIGYDCYFYGEEYGKQYEKDKMFLKEKNVEMISLIPEKIVDNEVDSLWKVLKRVSFGGKIVLFGTGKYFEYYMQKYGQKFPPAYAVDNQKEKWETQKQNIVIRNPEKLREEKQENVLVILCCKQHTEIKQQMLRMGDFDYRTLRKNNFLSALEEFATAQQMEKKYKKGYLLRDFVEFDEKSMELMKACKEKCSELIVGIPTDELILRMTDRQPVYSYKEKREKILQQQIVDEVVAVDIDNINVKDSHPKIGYDLCFYGIEYGHQYQDDKLYLLDKEVEMFSLIPSELQKGVGEDPIWIALQNASKDRKVVLFGTGNYFEYYMQKYGKSFPPSYAVDNRKEKWNTRKQDVVIRDPEILKKEDPQKTIIILCCKNYQEILEQVLSMGDFDYRSLIYNPPISILEEYGVILLEEKNYMKKAHTILIKLITEFDAVCQKYGLRYYIIAGSLIGVVRHKGLIPWDDDIDVAMYRRDYEILREKASEIWAEGSEFMFLDYDQLGNGAFYDFMTRIVYMKEDVPTRLFKKVEGKARKDIQNKLVMDIYVMENADSNEKKHKVITALMKAIYALAIGHRAKVDYSEYEFLSRPMLGLVRLAISIGRVIPLKFLFFLFEKLRGYAKNKECNYVFESNNGAINYMPWRYEKRLFGEGKRLPMCGYNVMVPSDYDGLLKAKGYGDYMSFPPVNVRKPSHSIKASGIIW